ncbi:glycoside hydrolase family 6 protein [Curtobacterium herbarum]|uniref:glycoside hydrolase family 6 protein n=1 Tax=Curtobacterium herbarum TaxID=150122 RepID=UPI001959BF72|nr:glycoside hydrolase family 6 protein [Curtobacterium herbarum]MBM7475993.1 endoglucanase [Curtobacterium herbarum]MCS6544438.1 glycoside hydrolase family 6 protein [Curtobacterium herbarum]
MPRPQRTSSPRQWVWIGIVGALLVAVVVAVSVVLPHAGERPVAHRRTVAEAFPGGIARQPSTANQPRRHETTAREAGRASTADRLAVIADQPIATWLTSASVPETVATVRSVLASAREQRKTPVFVLYAIPHRDCGHWSRGGTTEDGYLPWVHAVVRALAGSHAVVLVEPDSIAQIAVCERLRDTRLPLLRKAVTALTGHGLTVYLDGGNENRVAVRTMADWLRQAGVDRVQGFATNVSNFYRVDQERAYADELADAIGGDPHFVIDVSRNGRGWLGDWCNPEGAGLGQLPHVTRGTSRLDALLWVKTPGLSDGSCNGGPAAGQWWESYALALVENRKRD